MRNRYIKLNSQFQSQHANQYYPQQHSQPSQFNQRYPYGIPMQEFRPDQQLIDQSSIEARQSLITAADSQQKVEKQTNIMSMY